MLFAEEIFRPGNKDDSKKTNSASPSPTGIPEPHQVLIFNFNFNTCSCCLYTFKQVL